MKFLSRLWIGMLVVLALPACSLMHAKKPAKPPAPPASEAPTLIGRIASIPADKRFVLIQSYSNGKIEAGTILTTRGLDERTANLVATGESLGQFTAADVQSGLPGVGDAVYSRHIPKPATPTTATEPAEIQEPILPEPVLKK